MLCRVWWSVVLVSLSLIARADEESDFKRYLDNTKALLEKQHLVATVQMTPLEEGEAKSFRYDRYPEVERLQYAGQTYVRKMGQTWKRSDDWGETGVKVPKDKADEISFYAKMPMIPIENEFAPRDKTQGGLIHVLQKSEPVEGGERLYYEQRREHSTNFSYPQYVFHRYKDDDNALLEGFAGQFYVGNGKARMNITYGFLIKVNVTDVTVTPPEKPGTPVPVKKKKR